MLRFILEAVLGGRATEGRCLSSCGTCRMQVVRPHCRAELQGGQRSLCEGKPLLAHQSFPRVVPALHMCEQWELPPSTLPLLASLDSLLLFLDAFLVLCSQVQCPEAPPENSSSEESRSSLYFLTIASQSSHQPSPGPKGSQKPSAM